MGLINSSKIIIILSSGDKAELLLGKIVITSGPYVSIGPPLGEPWEAQLKKMYVNKNK